MIVVIYRLILCCSLLLPICALSQQVWDEMDVVDGPNPTLRYGFYSETSGRLVMGRYYFIDDGDSLRVRLVPFGKKAVELPVRSFDRVNGVLNLGWEGISNRACRLDRQNESLFLGNCIENHTVMPIAIRVANKYDDEWQGTNFAVSEVDIAILDKAKAILADQGDRNRNGDRNCEDDVATDRMSLFCALYVASIEVDGTYRHRRPATQTVRNVLRSRYPDEYAHILRDVNNDPNRATRDLLDAIDHARAQLLSQLQESRH